MNASTLVIAAPVRDRAWILPEWWQCLSETLQGLNGQYERHVTFLLLNGPHSDDTPALVASLAERAESTVVVEEFPEPGPRDYRWSRHTDGVYTHLARCRERIRQFAAEHDADLFSVDTDVLVTPATAARLHAALPGRHFVAALLSNHLSGTFSAPNAMDVTIDASVDTPPVRLGWCNQTPLGCGVRLVTGYTGAVFMASAAYLRAATYHAAVDESLPLESMECFGEDLMLAASGRRFGMHQWLDETTLCMHCMDRDRLNEVQAVKTALGVTMAKAAEVLALHQWAADLRRGLVGIAAWQAQVLAQAPVVRRVEANNVLRQQCVPWQHVPG